MFETTTWIICVGAMLFDFLHGAAAAEAATFRRLATSCFHPQQHTSVMNTLFILQDLQAAKIA